MTDPDIRACLRYGWTAIAALLLLGLGLESLHLVKAPLYFEVRIRRELWTLAQVHGGLLALMTVVFVHSAAQLMRTGAGRRRASLAMRIGALLVPLGFLLGGIGNTETDPSLAIVMVPLGAVFVLHAVVTLGIAAWKDSPIAGEVPTPDSAAPPVSRKGRKHRRK